MKIGSAGSYDSSDVFIKVIENDRLEIEIESIVKEQFGEDIQSVIENTLKELQIDHIKVLCHDKGALNYTIKARLLTALSRMRDDHA